MPEIQNTLFGPPQQTLPTMPFNQRCYGCGEEFLALVNGPDEQAYCATCFNLRFRRCSECDNDFDYRGLSTSGHLCGDCYSRLFFRCASCGRTYCHGLECNLAFDNEPYCDSCFSHYFFTCANCNVVHRRNERYNSPEGETWCEECFNRDCIRCHNCGDSVEADNAFYQGTVPYCSDCYHNSNEWSMGEFNSMNPTFDVIGSTRKYGIELETSQCSGHTALNGNTIWECKHDCSISGMEFVSPILFGDAGLMEIEKFCAEANSRSFEIDMSCGYHAHFDVSNESEDSLKAIAYTYRKTYDLWNACVSSNRSDNRYCGSPDYNCEDIVNEDWDYFVGKRDRFEYVNWRSYLVHGSVEVRLYQGTLDAAEICNWVKLHARFIDFIRNLSFRQIDEMFRGDMYAQYAALTNIVGNELGDYWAEKSRRAGHNLRRLVEVEGPNIQHRTRSRVPSLTPTPVDWTAFNDMVTRSMRL